MSEYRPNKLLAETVQSGDAYSVRGALVAIILSEPSFSDGTIYKAIEYAEKNGISVFESHNTDMEMETDTSAWNEAYFSRVSNQLGENFSKERLAHLEKVGKKVYGSAIQSSAEPRQTSAQRPPVSHTRPQTRPDNNNALDKDENFLTSHQAAVVAIAAIAVVAAVIIIVKKIIL